MDLTGLCTFQSMLSLLPLALHCLGIYLLRTSSSYAQNQCGYLIQLSCTELMFLLSHNNILLYLTISDSLPRLTSYLSLFITYFVHIPWCNVLILLTVDRFAQIWLNINYDIYVNALGTRFAAAISWLIGATLFLLLMCTEYVLKMHCEELMVALVTNIFMGIVVLIGVISYSYIAWKITRKNAVQRCRVRRRKTFVPFCIVISFTMFYIVPNIVYLVEDEKGEWERDGALYYHVICLILSDLCCIGDALVYLLSDNCTRKKFLGIVSCGFRNRRKLTIQDTLIKERRVTLTRIQRTKSFRQPSFYDVIEEEEPEHLPDGISSYRIQS